MPIIRDRIFPEVESSGFYSRTLRVLADSRATSKKVRQFAENVFTLREYLKCPDLPALEVELFAAPGKLPDYLLEFDVKSLPASSILLSPKEEIEVLAERNDIDLVATEDNHLMSIHRVASSKYWIADFDAVLRSIECFCRGHNVPWAFRQPAWKAPWTTFHSLFDENGSSAKDLYISVLSVFPEEKEAQELAANLLLNRMTHIIYTKDMLHFLNLQRRFSIRRGWSHQDFSFELSYLLNYYYLLLWGGIDQLSCLINAILGLQIRNRTKVSIGNQWFVNKVSAACPDIGKQLAASETERWLKQLKTNRNLAAHTNVIHLTQILELPAVMPTDEELEAEAKTTRSWEGLKKILSSEQFDRYHQTLKQQIFFGKCKRITGETATVEEGGKQYHSFPLVDVDWNFGSYQGIIVETLAHLSRFCINSGQARERSEK